MKEIPSSECNRLNCCNNSFGYCEALIDTKQSYKDRCPFFKTAEDLKRQYQAIKNYYELKGENNYEINGFKN